jgi:hypothetical protein
MPDTYSIKVNGSEVARFSGNGITLAKKTVPRPGSYEMDLVDDPKMLKVVCAEKTILVLYVSGAENVVCEKVSDGTAQPKSE